MLITATNCLVVRVARLSSPTHCPRTRSSACPTAARRGPDISLQREAEVILPLPLPLLFLRPVVMLLDKPLHLSDSAFILVGLVVLWVITGRALHHLCETTDVSSCLLGLAVKFDQ